VRRDFHRFRYFSAGWVTRAPRDASVVADARYSLATDDFEPIWGVRFRPAQPVPTEWVARDRERKIPRGERWQEITRRAEAIVPCRRRGSKSPATTSRTLFHTRLHVQLAVLRRLTFTGSALRCPPAVPAAAWRVYIAKK